MSNRLDGMSMNIEQTEMEKLKSVFPQCFAEGKLDIDKLLSLCGEYIDNDFEKYKFEWKGKIEALKLAQKRSTGTLRPCKAESVNFDETKNLYIEGDNLEVLKLLQTAYYNKIKMIYIDPPYNTGNDFVYEDDFADPMARYKEVTQQTTKSNPETMGRYHTNWLNMMYPRLRLAANLLKDDGVIFISIGADELSNLKKLCDEVFGEENCCGIVSRVMKSGGAKGRFFSPNTEYILVYAKNISALSSFREPISEDIIKKLYTAVEESGERKGEKYRPFGLYQSSLDARPNQRYYIECPDGTFVIPPGETMPEEIKDGAMVIPKETDGCWRWSRERYLEEKEKGNIAFKKSKGVLLNSDGDPAEWNIYTKIWLNDRQEEGMVPVDLITKWENRQSKKELQELSIPFDFAKPVDLIKYLITIVENTKNDIVLDFFSGSATTAHAVMQLNAEDGGNRKFICVQLPELCDEKSEAYKAGYKNICEIGKERIRRAGQKIQDTFAKMTIKMQDRELSNEEKPVKLMFNTVISKEPNISVQEFHTDNLDIGFKVFKLDTSNLKIWDNTPIEDTQIDLFYKRMNDMIDSIKDDRTDMDVVYEVMLKMGVPLDVPVTYTDINDKIAYVVGDMLILICLADNITAEDIEKMADFAPAKIVCAEQGFADDSALSNAHYILKDKEIELKLV